jgi:hypothetical protein
MTNRLPYETLAGNLSSEETYKQLVENLRLATENAQSLSSMAKARNDLAKAKIWQGFADNFIKIQSIIILLAKAKAKSSIGFTS